MKKAILILCLFLFVTEKTQAKEGSVVIINQLRGDEICCQSGNLDLINEVKNKINYKETPIAWALRYDVLKNKDFLKNIADLGEFGLLLEVTPNLARESLVTYKGRKDGSDWYFAKNAFLVGYTKEERKKIIDTLFTAFKQEFGYYPSFTVSWMIDAWSLDYINKTYAVKLHEITKEQYETDAYTLYGGIFNEPYYPSRDNPLIPATENNKLNMLIIRQTNSDLLQNYGSSKAYYTSQPNDYLQSPEKLDIKYFQSLLDDVTNQSSGSNFGLFGFENSFSWNIYGNEYIKQLSLLGQYQKEDRINIFKPSDFYFEFTDKYSDNKPFYLIKSFVPNSFYGTVWYFGKQYRARIIIQDGKVILDDLRNFLDTPDPYRDKPVTADYAYWINPYLFDGSLLYYLSSSQQKLVKKNDLFYGSTLSEKYTYPFGIVLGQGNFNLSEKENSLAINFTDKKGTVEFTPQEIVFDENLGIYFNAENKNKVDSLFQENSEQVFKFNKHFDLLVKKSKETLDLGWLVSDQFIPLFEIIKDNNKYILKPKEEKTSLELLAPIFQPDRSDLPIDKNKSIFYWNNKKAIVERNPVRLFILPLNTLGRPTQISNIEVDSPKKNKLTITFPSDYKYRISPWFVDITSDQAMKTVVSLSIDGTNILKDAPIEFITDCKKNFNVCLTSSVQTIKYMSAIVNERYLKLKTSISKIWIPLIN